MTYFDEDEFTMGGVNVFHMMDEDFLVKLDELRHRCGFPLSLNSTYRTHSYNLSVGGSPNSQHLLGKAADVHCEDSRKRAVLVREALNLGLTVGVYQTFVHVDNRDGQLMFYP